MKKSACFALLAAALALPATAAAQNAASPPPPAMQEEISRIQQRVAQLQMQASQDSVVRVQEAEFSSYLMSAMERSDATAKETFARAEALKAEVEAARTAQDNAKLNALAAEAMELQTFFSGLRQRVLAQPDVMERRNAYLSALLARMNEMDPQAQALINRLQELHRRPERP